MSGRHYEETNKALWDELAVIHSSLHEYGTEKLVGGKTTLHSTELEEIGPVHGNHLLHLQCHIGLDTLSWARAGAIATGVDFSPRSIQIAKELASQLGVNAEFLCCSVEQLPANYRGKYDVVFASHGCIPWISSLRDWMQTAADCLKPGGRMYLMDNHPLAHILNYKIISDNVFLFIGDAYFPSSTPERCITKGSYACRDAKITTHINYQWPHSVGEIINSVVDSGLTLQFFHEFTYCSYQKFPFMQKDVDGWWHLPTSLPRYPMLFSMLAVKP